MLRIFSSRVLDRSQYAEDRYLKAVPKSRESIQHLSMAVTSMVRSNGGENVGISLLQEKLRTQKNSYDLEHGLTFAFSHVLRSSLHRSPSSRMHVERTLIGDMTTSLHVSPFDQGSHVGHIQCTMKNTTVCR